MKNTKWNRFKSWVDGVAQEYEPLQVPETSEKQSGEKTKRLSEKQRFRIFNLEYHCMVWLVCLTLVCVLIYTIFQLPLFGDPTNPAVNDVVKRYVEKGLEETGAVNMVAGMILDYRAFDTFGESSVLFLAVTCVMMLLLRDQNNIDREEDLQAAREKIIEREAGDLVLRSATALIMPCILLFGIYVVLNGHISPGGGFSGGAVMGAGLILCSAAYGSEAVGRFFNIRTFRTITSAALLCYGASKAYSFFTGANNLPTGIPLGTPGAIFSSGLILVLDICVGMVVACTMYGFYCLFAKGDI